MGEVSPTLCKNESREGEIQAHRRALKYYQTRKAIDGMESRKGRKKS